MEGQDEQDPGVWQAPDPQRAQERVRRLEASAARLREAARRDAELTQELEDIHSALAVARIDLHAHRRQRASLDEELARRRAEATIRQRREVVELYEESERRLLDGGVGGARLDAIRAGLRAARAELERAEVARTRGIAAGSDDCGTP